MLEGLNNIDWNKLEHAYGPATDVPALLLQLASPIEGERKEAIDALYGNIWHQGTVYEASAYAAPFLIELLKSESVSGKAEILVLLASLAKGTSYHDVHQHLLFLKEEAEKPEWKANIAKELIWVHNTAKVVKSGEQVYLSLFLDTDPSTRDALGILLASLGSPDLELAKKIWSQLELEKDRRVKCSLLLAFGVVAEPTDTNRDLLFSAWKSAQEKSVELAAALSLVQIAPDEVPRDALTLILEAASHLDGFEVLESSYWVQIDEMELLIRRHLSLLENQSAHFAVEWFAKMLASQTHPRALAIAEILLNLVFQGPISKASTFSELSEIQQRVLRIIAESPNVWAQSVGGEMAESVRTSLLMKSCGLPNKLEGFLSFVASPRPL